MTLDDFEKCIVRLIALARERGIERLEPGSRDYYWCVMSPEWVDMTQSPKQLCVGSLDDDLMELRRLVDDPDRASVIDLDRAASLLHMISEDMSS